MQNKNRLLSLVALFGLSASPALAGYNVYPPTVIKDYTFFEDSDNQVNAALCVANPNAICVSASYLPKGIKLAKTEQNFAMLSQSLYFSYLSWWKSSVVYNLTLEPDYGDVATNLADYRLTLAQKYGVRPENVDLSPVNVTQVQFIVRNTFGTQDDIANTTYTKTITPAWTGDYHTLGSKFSVSIKGPRWDLEPTLQEAFLNKAANAVVGQLSFGVVVKATAFKGEMSCDIKQFQDTIKDIVKAWNISHVESGNNTVDTFGNDERNAIRSRLRIENFCLYKEFIDSYHVKESDVKARGAQLFDLLFNKAFIKISDAQTPVSVGGQDGKYTALNSVASMDASGFIKINLDQAYTFELKSDLDFYAGGVTEENLDPAHKYNCQHFERFDRDGDKCVLACDPSSEVYLPGQPGARRDGCLDIQSAVPPKPLSNAKAKGMKKS